MMRATCLPTLGILCFIGCSNPIENPAPLNEQIEKLASPRFREREDAAKWLRQHAAESLPELRKQRQHPDEDVRNRLDKLITDVEREVALQPSRVTLNVTDTPVSEVLKEIEKQTKCKVVLAENMEDKSVSMNLNRATFWDAIQELERQTGYQFSQRDHEKLIDSDRQIVHFQQKGIFRLIVVAVYEDRDLHFQKANLTEGHFASRRKIKLVMELEVEPRIELHECGTMILKDGIDDGGRPLRPCKDHPERLFSPNGVQRPGRPKRFFEIDLMRPEEPSSNLSEVRVLIPMILLLDRRPLIVPGNYKSWQGQNVMLSGESVTIDRVMAKDRTMLIEMSYKGILEYNRLNYVHCFLRDAKLQPLEWASSGSYRKNDRFIFSRLYKLPDSPGFLKEDLNLIGEEWSVVDVEIPFELKNIPLP